MDGLDLEWFESGECESPSLVLSEGDLFLFSSDLDRDVIAHPGIVEQIYCECFDGIVGFEDHLCRMRPLCPEAESLQFRFFLPGNKVVIQKMDPAVF